MRFVYVLLILSICSCSKECGKTILFVGSYTNGEPKEGIFVYDFDLEEGSATLMYAQDSIINPSYLQISKSGSVLYALTNSQLETSGMVTSFTVNRFNGALSQLASQSTLARNPVHITLSPDETMLVASTYTEPSISLYNVASDGSLRGIKQFIAFQDFSVLTGRQDDAHIHSANFSSDGQFLIAQDLGSDKMRVFSVRDTLIDEDAGDVHVEPGSGPRHFTFHPKGTWAYALSEMAGAIDFYLYSDGEFMHQERSSSYENKQDEYRAADIHISPDGKFVYTSNRGPEEHSIAIFSISSEGDLELRGHQYTGGEHPRNFAIDPSGKFLIVANQFTDNVVIFRRSETTGLLTKTPYEIEVPSPSSIQLYTY